jgi:RNA polymerase sigma factor (sigma-70 family)
MTTRSAMTEATPTMLRSLLAARYDDLKARLSRRLGSAELANDALQDTYVRLERAEVSGPVRSPAAYLFRMAFNLAMDQKRAEKRLLDRNEVHDLLNIADEAPGPAQIVEARLEAKALEKVIAELPARRRVILLAARLQGMPQREIARRLGVSLRLVEKELRRAQEYCAQKLGK